MSYAICTNCDESFRERETCQNCGSDVLAERAAILAWLGAESAQLRKQDMDFSQREADTLDAVIENIEKLEHLKDKNRAGST